MVSPKWTSRPAGGGKDFHSPDVVSAPTTPPPQTEVQPRHHREPPATQAETPDTNVSRSQTWQSDSDFQADQREQAAREQARLAAQALIERHAGDTQSLRYLLTRTYNDPQLQSPNSVFSPKRLNTVGFSKRVARQMQESHHLRLREEYVQLQTALRQLRYVPAIIGLFNGKSGGKSTVAANLSATLVRNIGVNLLLADLNENAGGPASRSGIPIDDQSMQGKLLLQELVRHVNEDGLVVTAELLTQLDTHWQPGVGQNIFGLSEYGEGYKVLMSDPVYGRRLERGEFLRTGRMLKSACDIMVAETGNGQNTPLNKDAFELTTCPIFSALPEGESPDHLGYTLRTCRSDDEEKANNGLIVVNATTAGDFAERFADRFQFDPARVLFIPYHSYLVNGRDNVNGNPVRHDMVSLEVLVSLMRIARMALNQSAIWLQKHPLPELRLIEANPASIQAGSSLQPPAIAPPAPPVGQSSVAG